MPEKFNPRLRAAFLEAVENQLRDNDPPETSRTYERLLRDGHSEAQAKELIAAAIAAETFYIMKRGESFDLGRYVAMLKICRSFPNKDCSA